MVQLASYLNVLLHALALVGLAASMGCIVFVLGVLRPAVAATATPYELRVLRVAQWAAVLAIAAFAGVLLVGPWALAGDDGHWPFGDYLDTSFAHASLVRLVLLIGYAGLLAWLRGRPASATRWRLTLSSMLATIVSGAWAVHAVSRLEHVVPLMVSTILHQLAAVVWLGGAIGLLLCTDARRAADSTLWPRLLARFSPIGLACVLTLVGAGLYIAAHYVGDWASVIGTNYGIMVIAKWLLLAMALSLAGLNFVHTHRWRRHGDARGAMTRVPVYIEAETCALLAIVLLGASLAATPPAADLASERASFAEVVDTLKVKMPQLRPPDYAALMADYSSPLDFFNPSTATERIQSNFNHNMSGAFVLLIGVLAILHKLRLAHWARHWPLVFLPFTLFLLLTAQPTGWPLGPEGFFEQMRSPSVLQHRLATLLPLVIGVMEWRVQVGTLAATRWRYTFPLLCFLGGAVMLTHTHTALGTKQEFLIEVSHASIAVFAILAGIGRWLELRLPPPAPRITGVLWTGSLVMIGFLLLFYRE
ncbi:MAG TPA: CopD family protein [Gammaproteobacteria bacterium]|nr:CopD family protein [Gammaproteobacteria bacterium]